MKALVRKVNLPKPIHEATKAVRMGDPSHSIPSMLDIPNKKKLEEEVCVYRADKEGVAIFANKYNYSRALRTVSTAFHLYFHPEAFENTSFYEDDAEFFKSASVYEIAKKLIDDNFIHCHLEPCLDEDGEYLPTFNQEKIKDEVWYDERRFNAYKLSLEDEPEADAT